MRSEREYDFVGCEGVVADIKYVRIPVPRTADARQRKSFSGAKPNAADHETRPLFPNSGKGIGSVFVLMGNTSRMHVECHDSF